LVAKRPQEWSSSEAQLLVSPATPRESPLAPGGRTRGSSALQAFADTQRRRAVPPLASRAGEGRGRNRDQRTATPVHGCSRGNSFLRRHSTPARGHPDPRSGWACFRGVDAAAQLERRGLGLRPARGEAGPRGVHGHRFRIFAIVRNRRGIARPPCVRGARQVRRHMNVVVGAAHGGVARARNVSSSRFCSAPYPCPSPKRRPTVPLARERPIRGQDAEPGWR